MQNLEMVICPICHKPFPKRRQELGYNYCIDCSTERKKVAMIEGIVGEDGDDMVQSNIVIMSRDQARSISRVLGDYRNIKPVSDEDDYDEDDIMPDMRPVEDRDDKMTETEALIKSGAIDDLQAGEDEFSERVLSEFSEFSEK